MRDLEEGSREPSSPHAWTHYPAGGEMSNNAQSIEKLSDELFAEDSELENDETVGGLINPENMEEVNELLVSQGRKAVELPLGAEERTRIINALRQASGAGDLTVQAAHRLIKQVHAISQKEQCTGRQKQHEVLELLADIYYEFR